VASKTATSKFRPEGGMLEFLRRYGVTRGFLGGSRPWMVVGGAAYALKAVKWALQRDVEVVFSEEIRPGDRLVITPIAAEVARQASRRRRTG
jgi:hypothetical protein